MLNVEQICCNNCDRKFIYSTVAKNSIFYFYMKRRLLKFLLVGYLARFQKSCLVIKEKFSSGRKLVVVKIALFFQFLC